MYLPAKTPREIVDKLQQETAKALRGAGGAGAVRARSASSRCRSRQAEFAKFVRDDIEANVALVKAAKIPTQ